MVCNTLIYHTTDISIKQKGKSKSCYNSCYARQQILYYRKHAIVGIELCILVIYYVRGILLRKMKKALICDTVVFNKKELA